jgi:hypothetical protein
MHESECKSRTRKEAMATKDPLLWWQSRPAEKTAINQPPSVKSGQS